MDQSGYPPPYQQLPSPPAPQAGVVIAPRMPLFGKDSLQVTCRNCNQVVCTTVVAENGACSYIAAIVVFLLCFPCFWVPLVIDSCKDYRHMCPACNAILGVYKKV